MKKFISIILITILTFSAFSTLNINAFATETESDYTYTILDDGTVEITGYSGTDTDLIIPSVIDSHTVTVIGYSAFENCNLNSVVIPDSVHYIYGWAFGYCQNLKTVKIGCNVKSIGYSAFGYSKLKTVMIPDSVEIIENRAFQWCNSLENITIGNNVEAIKEYAFCGTNLKSIILPDSVETIGNNAFENCNLETVTIGKGLSSIGENAFVDNESLKSIFISDENEYFYDINGVLYNKQTNEIILYPRENDSKVLTVNEGVETLVDIDSENLEEINLPSTLKNIGEIDCSNLKNINVNENNPNLYSVNGVLFSNVTNEMFFPTKNTSVTLTIPEGITKLSSITSSELTEINIPSTVTKINTISGNNLENIFVSDDNPSYCDIDGVLYNKDITQLIRFPLSSLITDFKIPESVTTVNCSLENSKNLKNIYISKKLQTFEINNYFTLYGDNIENIIVDEENPIFYSKNGILFNKSSNNLICYPQNNKTQTFEIPEGTKAIISTLYLKDCKYLENVIIPESLTSYDERGLCFCPNIKNVYVHEDNPNYMDIDGVLFSKDKKTLLFYPQGRTDTTYNIPETTASISDAFHSCKHLTSIVIPNNVTSVSINSFMDCDNLKEVTFSKNIESIGISFGFYIGYPCWSWGPESLSKFEDITIKGYTNTCAEAYAKKYGFNFVSIGVVDDILGDANSDKAVNIQDATLVQMCVAKYPEKINTTNADIDKDGEITIRDATTVQMYVAKLIDTLYDV